MATRGGRRRATGGDVLDLGPPRPAIRASDARAAKEFTDTETILDRLDTHTAGGLRDVLDAIQSLERPASAARPDSPASSETGG